MNTRAPYSQRTDENPLSIPAPTNHDQHEANNLEPRLEILSGILPNVNVAKCSYEILDNTTEACAFVIDLQDEDQPPMGLPQQLLIRIQKTRENDPLYSVAALQKLTHSRIPHLVPKVWGVGQTHNADGESLTYLLSQHYQEVRTADASWEWFEECTKQSLMEQVVSAMQRLQSTKLTDLSDEKKDALTGTLFLEGSSQCPVVVGGPQVRYFPDMKSFLTSTLDPGKAKYEISAEPDGTVIIRDDFTDTNIHNPQFVYFAPENLKTLENASALCHNDIEPRNLPIRETATSVELVAIINWDAAGFFPFAYETAVKDTQLGQQNRSASWYEPFKWFSSCLLSDTSDVESQEKMVRAVVLADQGRRRSQGFHVGNRVQQKWLERERMERGHHSREGFESGRAARSAGPLFTQADDAKLEQEAMKELGYI